MSRYLQHLVMRNLGEAPGLRPRPATRYESVRQGDLAGFPESMEERSFKDFMSCTSPIETDISHIENIIDRGRQTDGLEWLRKRPQSQSGLFGEKIVEAEITMKTPSDPARPPHEVSQDGGVKLALSVLGPNTTLSDDPEASASPMAQPSKALSGMRGRAVQPAAVKSRPSSEGRQGVFSDSLRPTLKGGSFHPVRGEMIMPPTEARAPVVQIRIGRIEVRAVEPSAPSKKLSESPRSSLSLGQYLRRRSPEA